MLLGVLVGCGVPSGQLRLSGRYENIKQGDFLIFSPSGSIDRIDTLHVVNGEFEYQCVMNDEGTFCILYPNSSQLVVWAREGDDIRIKADVQDLWHTQVRGNEANELYTEFRLQNSPTDTTSLRRSAAQFIRQHPASRVALYLLQQYFVIPDGVPADSTNTLYKVIHDALPQDAEVVRLGGVIQQRYVLREGVPMPAFDLVTTDSVHHRLSQYKGQPLVLYFWAGWQSGSSYIHQQLSKMRDELKAPTHGTHKPLDVNLLSYSLDIDSVMLNSYRPNDECHIPNYCDRLGFNGPLINQLGIRRLPTFVVIGADGLIKCVASDAHQVRHYFEHTYK